MKRDETGRSLTAHSRELDALRGIAVLFVVKGHVTASWWGFSQAALVVPFVGVDAVQGLRFAPGGVFLFFLLSGYLLTTTEGARARRGDFRARSYLMRRALRILPAYYAAVLVAAFLWPADKSLGDVLSHLLFLHTTNPYAQGALDPAFWSLATEVVWYAALPLVLLLRVWQRALLMVALALVGRSIRWGILQGGLPSFLPEPTPFSIEQYALFFPAAHLHLFLAGSLLASLVGRLKKKKPPSWFPLATSAAASASLAATVLFPYSGAYRQGFLGVPPWLISDLVLTAFFASALLGAPLLRPILNWKPLVFLGTISFSLFLCHQTIILHVTPRVLPGMSAYGPWTSFGAYAVAVMLVSVPVAYLGYRFVERPFLSFKPR